MKILALETNEDCLKEQCISPSEQLLLSIHFSGFLFAARLLKSLFFTLILVTITVVEVLAGLPLEIGLPVTILVWIPLVGWKLLSAWIDWRYDVLLITTDKIIVVDQSSIIRSSVQQMNIENIATVTAHTQFGDLLPFGKLCFDLKEGTGQRLTLPYVPRARAVAATIANIVMDYEDRRAVKARTVLQRDMLPPNPPVAA